MKKFFKLLPLVVVASLTACQKYEYADLESLHLVLFGTPYIAAKMKIESGFNGDKSVSDIIRILEKFDKYADTKQRNETNVYTLNHTNEKTEISSELYHLLSRAKELQKEVSYFNPLVGSLSDKWKEALNDIDNPQPLSDEIIQEELEKINSSELILEEAEQKYYAQRVGEAQIDLGAITKGFVLDECLSYLGFHTGITEDYLFNLGSSSILLGKNSQRYKTNKGNNDVEGIYIVKVTDIANKEYLKTYKSFISTSGISEQGVKIGNQMYSHIINPITGSAINNYDQVTVISNDDIGKGALGDVLSTALMMSTEEEIKEAEKNFAVKVIAIKDGNIVYKSEGLTLYS